MHVQAFQEWRVKGRHLWASHTACQAPSYMKDQFDITAGPRGLLLASRWVDTDTRHMYAHLPNLLPCFL